jgi:RNA polymerase sigma factor (sigma-70 family)
MTVIDRPWLFKDDDGLPRFRISWHEETRPAQEPRWPGPRAKKVPQAHDDQTKRLISTYREMYRLEESNVVVPLLEEWKWRDKMHTPAEKQEFLEPLLARVRRDPQAHRGEMIFLLLVCEGVRRGVANRLLGVRTGLDGASPAPDLHRREEARRIAEIERERLHEVTRRAVMEALYRYPANPPRHFFGWLRETVSHRTLDFLKEELTELEAVSHRQEEAEAMQAFLAGFDDLEAPELAEGGGFRRWLFKARPLWGPVRSYLDLQEVRYVCRTAIDRLPRRQREVIDGEFYESLSPEEIAKQQGVARSTVYNSKAQALRNLHDDDCFFMALCGMELVRDSVRKAQLLERHPDGLLPDGRRIVFIDAA